MEHCMVVKHQGQDLSRVAALVLDLVWIFDSFSLRVYQSLLSHHSCPQNEVLFPVFLQALSIREST